MCTFSRFSRFCSELQFPSSQYFCWSWEQSLLGESALWKFLCCVRGKVRRVLLVCGPYAKSRECCCSVWSWLHKENKADWEITTHENNEETKYQISHSAFDLMIRYKFRPALSKRYLATKLFNFNAVLISLVLHFIMKDA